MKIKFLLSLLLSFSFCLLSSQVPQGFNYQAIARDGSGNILANQALPVKIDIQTSLTGGTLVYEETFGSVITNQFGLISLVIGTGTQTDGTATSFSAIDWKSQTLYLKTIIQYPGTTWTTMGTSQIWGVPYSLVAKDVQGPISKLGITGTTDNMEEALFEVKNKDGQTVFAVYNEGIRAYVGNGNAKGVKGGFSIGGYDATKSKTVRDIFVLSTDSARFYLDSKPQGTGKGVRGGFSVGGYDMTKGTAMDYLAVSKDSFRIYLDTDPNTKGVKGGFSVGGYDMTKGGIQNYLNVSPDSVRVYINDTHSVDKKGGFAVGGFNSQNDKINYLKVTGDSTRIVTSDTIKGFGISNLKSNGTNSYLRLTPSNYFIGHKSGGKITSGLYNSSLGYMSGYSLTSGLSNSLIGYQAGYSITEGIGNICIGFQSGYNTTGNAVTAGGFYNLFAGNEAGFNNTLGGSNIFLGFRSGYNNTTGSRNIFIGTQNGLYNTTGNYNVFLGYQAGLLNSTGTSNVIVGNLAGWHNTTAGNNVFIGDGAGYSNSTGSSNVFIGMSSGVNNESGQRNVYIGEMSGGNNKTGLNNVFLGNFSGAANLDGNSNLFIGAYAGGYTSSGSGNIFLGDYAGSNCSGLNNVMIGSGSGNNNYTGSNNVFIGSFAGYSETGTAKLYIETLNSPYPLIGGDFTGRRVGINCMPGTYTLEVGGTIWANGATISAGSSTWSDARYKINVKPLTDGLESIMKLNGVYFDWDRTDYPGLNFPGGNQVGLIAQEVEKILPQVVCTDPEGYKSVSYDKLTPVLIQAVKEQQKTIESQRQEIENLKQRLDKIESLINK